MAHANVLPNNCCSEIEKYRDSVSI
uniref:Uncharacterized protein n=1 Tax=Anguilla anguilla TaxID=7936 RepID=A0A0E9S3Y6_ANGAN